MKKKGLFILSMLLVFVYVGLKSFKDKNYLIILKREIFSIIGQ